MKGTQSQERVPSNVTFFVVHTEEGKRKNYHFHLNATREKLDKKTASALHNSQFKWPEDVLSPECYIVQGGRKVPQRRFCMGTFNFPSHLTFGL